MHTHFHPKFSLITVTYNAGAVLEDTIQSIITQTYKNVEYILIDGASTDNTMRIIERYRDHIHTVVSEPDQGLYDAMNKGLSLATGDYVCFLNAGDCLHEDDTLLGMVHSVAASHEAPCPPDVLYGDTALVDSEGHFLRMRRLTPPEHLTWKSFRHGMLVCHQAFFARRAIAPQYDLRYRFSADFDWCIRVMKQARYLHNTHLTLVDYLDEGLTTRNHRASLIERFHIMCRHYGTVPTVMRHLWFALRTLTHPKRVQA
ncbi:MULTISPECIES: glycosyltransferase family 2 protein [Mediterranea]|uniref:glycosyltransferase family 2 protein n=1 Tax=Mediterranea TaxID=1926659 RepID=UPI002013297A|nr:MULTISPECIES: glycosyltransferase family 2 protein [Mediterranea]MCL1607192.1 glycosyltransferase [Mediterranea sp. ET5]MDM8121670.1 glycosyltransferase family 2 protein [Mediterranea massiliensis]MDM8198599.1 glycosyltransferase family 2 protein [Mediterranea massiliensis]